MRKLLITAVVAVSALVLAAGGAAALAPGVYDPDNTGCPKATYAKGVLHLEKNCATTVNAAAGAEITGASGQTFQSAEFTLASASQCQGGSPRFIVVTNTGLYPLGCNNVAPTTNKNGTATYVFTAETLAASGQQVPTPTGTISFVSVLIDVQGTADLTRIKFNGQPQKAAVGKGQGLGAACKNGGWKTFTSPKFKNQGQCVKWVVHTRNAARKHG
jgi:hypothetical protein